MRRARRHVDSSVCPLSASVHSLGIRIESLLNCYIMEKTARAYARSLQHAAGPRRTLFTVIGALLLIVLSMVTIHLQSAAESTPAGSSAPVVTEISSIVTEAETSADPSAAVPVPENSGQPQHLDWMTLCFLAMLATLALLVLPHRLRTLTLNIARAPGLIQPRAAIPATQRSPIELSVISRT